MKFRGSGDEWRRFFVRRVSAMDAMHRLVRRVTVSLQVARVALGIQNNCGGRSIWVIWRGIEPRFLDCRVDGDDSRPLQNGVIFRPFDVTASFTLAAWCCGCGTTPCQKLEGIEYDVRQPRMSNIRRRCDRRWRFPVGYIICGGGSRGGKSMSRSGQCRSHVVPVAVLHVS